jgi:hypothetical protein
MGTMLTKVLKFIKDIKLDIEAPASSNQVSFKYDKSNLNLNISKKSTDEKNNQQLC